MAGWTMIEMACQLCGKPYMARLTQVRQGKSKYCSRLCSNRAASAKSAASPRPRFPSPIPSGPFVEGLTFLDIHGSLGYRVGSDGSVWSCADGSWHSLALSTRAGYLYVSLGKGKKADVHVLVAAHFIGPRPYGYTVNHKDGNKKNNTPENLEYLTNGDNIRHAFATGLNATGERHPHATISEATAREVKRLLAAGLGRREVSNRTGVAWHTVYNIARGHAWKRLSC